MAFQKCEIQRLTFHRAVTGLSPDIEETSLRAMVRDGESLLHYQQDKHWAIFERHTDRHQLTDGLLTDEEVRKQLVREEEKYVSASGRSHLHEIK